MQFFCVFDKTLYFNFESLHRFLWPHSDPAGQPEPAKLCRRSMKVWNGIINKNIQTHKRDQDMSLNKPDSRSNLKLRPYIIFGNIVFSLFWTFINSIVIIWGLRLGLLWLLRYAQVYWQNYFSMLCPQSYPWRSFTVIDEFSVEA